MNQNVVIALVAVGIAGGFFLLTRGSASDARDSVPPPGNDGSPEALPEMRVIGALERATVAGANIYDRIRDSMNRAGGAPKNTAPNTASGSGQANTSAPFRRS